MTAPTIELFEMPGATASVASQTRMKKYGLIGIADEVAALNYALQVIPMYLSAEALFRQDMQQSAPGADLYHFDVKYGPVPKLEPGEWSWSFDTTGGSIHWNYSLECVKAYTPDNPGPGGDADQAKITAVGYHPLTGVIDGTERVVPVSKRSYTYTHPAGVVLESYEDYLESITGVVNSTPWHNRPSGEVLFLGARGTSTAGATAKCSVTYDFALSKNVRNQTYGVAGWDRVTGIDKDGHHFLDVVFEDQPGGDGKPSQQIQCIRIHRMYEELNFNTYLGF